MADLAPGALVEDVVGVVVDYCHGVDEDGGFYVGLRGGDGVGCAVV